MKPVPRLLLIAAALGGMTPALALASCGASMCAINTNWTSESALAEAGNAFDLRYESMKQYQPMTGTRKLYVGQVRAHHDEVSTDNRNLLASFSRNFGNGFGLTVSGGISDRDHQHIHNHHGAVIPGAWHYSRLTDIRVLGRYQLAGQVDPLKPASSGLTFGLKLPAGKTDIANGQGKVGERSMQPGTGTTDLIVGAFHHQRFTAHDASWFAQAQYQRALREHDSYKPGAQLGLDLGVRKGIGGNVGLLGQLNYVHKGADSGTLQAYAYYQRALYRNVRGVQLTANSAFVLGLSGQL
jgi:hypothetical protein